MLPASRTIDYPLIILLDFRRPLGFFTAMRIRFLGAAPTTPAILCVPEGDDEAGK
jgi:hypothetical protein